MAGNNKTNNNPQSEVNNRQVDSQYGNASQSSDIEHLGRVGNIGISSPGEGAIGMGSSGMGNSGVNTSGISSPDVGTGLDSPSSKSRSGATGMTGSGAGNLNDEDDNEG